MERLLEEGKETQGALTRQVFIADTCCGSVFPIFSFREEDKFNDNGQVGGQGQDKQAPKVPGGQPR